MKWERFFERFTTSVSFSAYTALSQRVLPPLYVRGLVPLWIACVAGTRRLRGLQDVFAMLAGQGLCDLVPMPMEPSGYLVLPSVLIYLALLASVSWAVSHGLGAHGEETPMGAALTTAIEQFLSFFSVTRAVQALKSAGQAYPLYVLSLAFTVLSDNYEEEEEEGRWTTCLRRNLEGVAMRGVSAWLLTEVLDAQHASSDALLVLQLTCVYLSGWTPRLRGIHAVLSTNTARQLLRLLAEANLSEAARVCGLAAVTTLFVLGAPEQTHVFADLCGYVASLLLTSVLERSWLVQDYLLEAGSLYLVAFCFIEVLQRNVQRILISATTTPSSKEKEQLPQMGLRLPVQTDLLGLMGLL
jgi:hypothetical protein